MSVDFDSFGRAKLRLIYDSSIRIFNPNLDS